MSLIIPVFLPHEGCRHRCVFCDQRQISGATRNNPLDAPQVSTIIHSWLAHTRAERRKEAQVAFYGGSFTALPIARQKDLLAAVQPFLDQGLVRDIRLSTRPDAIDKEGLALLRDYGVSIIELGVQSCDDRVLRRSGRGHNARASITASALIKESGHFRLGIQLMPGLPGDTFATLRQSTCSVMAMQPDFVRIYPTLVLQGSRLADLYQQGHYQPLSLARATLLCAWMKKRFDEQGIRVIRMGLQASPSLEQALLAGPYHPAFGQLVDSRLMLNKIRGALAKAGKERIGLVLAQRDLSLFYGHGGRNIRRLEQLGLRERFSLRADPGQARFSVRTEAFNPTFSKAKQHAQH